MRIVLLLIGILVSNIAHSCEELARVCVEGAGERVINGRKVHRECWRYEVEYECLGDVYKEGCKALQERADCAKIEETCTKWQGEKCAGYTSTYQCSGEIIKEDPKVKFLKTDNQIQINNLEKSQYLGEDSSSRCIETQSICLEGPESRNIEGSAIYKDCWKYQKKYMCFNKKQDSSCSDYENKCILKAENCLSKIQEGYCIHTEKKYECLDLNNINPTKLDCKIAKYCIGERCSESTYEGDKNFARAISALSILTNIKKDFLEAECKEGAENCKVFKGQGHSCKINPIGSRNCCKEKGWANDLKLTSCSEEEQLLSQKKEAKLCKQIGSFCAKKVAGICIQRKRTYCCFGSKLARIIHEEGRRQLGISWGTAEKPDCAPLSIKQLQRINFDQIDLSEIYQEITAPLNLNTHNKIAEDAAHQATQHLSEKKKYGDEIAKSIREYYEQ